MKAYFTPSVYFVGQASTAIQVITGCDDDGVGFPTKNRELASKLEEE